MPYDNANIQVKAMPLEIEKRAPKGVSCRMDKAAHRAFWIHHGKHKETGRDEKLCNQRESS